MAETLEDAIARAIGDPGSILDRYPEETVTRWSTRAVLSLFDLVAGVDQDAFRPGTPGTRALMENAQLRATQETLLQDIIMWRNRARDAEKALGMGVDLDV